MESTDFYQSGQKTTDYSATMPLQPVPVYLPPPAPYPRGLIRLTFVLVFYALVVLMYQFPPMDLLRSFSNQLGAFTSTAQPVALYSGDYRGSAALIDDKYMYRLKTNRLPMLQKQKCIRNKRGLTDAELPISAGMPPAPASINLDSTASAPEALVPVIPPC